MPWGETQQSLRGARPNSPVHPALAIKQVKAARLKPSNSNLEDGREGRLLNPGGNARFIEKWPLLERRLFAIDNRTRLILPIPVFTHYTRVI